MKTIFCPSLLRLLVIVIIRQEEFSTRESGKVNDVHKIMPTRWYWQQTSAGRGANYCRRACMASHSNVRDSIYIYKGGIKYNWQL